MATKKLQILDSLNKNAVLYTPQELTEEEKSQARANLNVPSLDENGKIPTSQLPDDIGGGLTEVSWNDLKDKPFGESGLRFIQDDVSSAIIYVSTEVEGMEVRWYKVSEPYNGTLYNAKLQIAGESEIIIGADSDFTLTELESGSSYIMYVLNILEDNEVIGVEELGIPSLTIPEKGLYILDPSILGTSLEYFQSPDYGEIKKIDKKFIPDDIGGGVTSWNDLEDKPFYETGWTVEWDGNTSGLEFYDLGEGICFYKVSSNTFSETDLLGVNLRAFFDGTDIDEEISQSGDMQLSQTDGGNLVVIYAEQLPMVFIVSNSGEDTLFGELPLNFTSTGIWFFGVSQTERVYSLGKGEIKKIDKKFIPDDIVASVSLTFDETPTEGSQNPVKSMGIHSAISALEGKITSTFCYKGTVVNYSDLPTSDNVIGDVWNIANADETNGVNAGDNAAWNGNGWDILAGIVDLSDYYTKIEIDSIALNGTVNLANYYTKAEIDDMIGDCDTIIGHINTLIGGVSV